MQPTKRLKKRMRELMGIAYERELRLELEKLATQFQLWQQDKIDTFELEHLIHKFHILYNRYTVTSAGTVLPYALANGLISEEECPDELAEEMRMSARIIYEEEL